MFTPVTLAQKANSEVFHAGLASGLFIDRKSAEAILAELDAEEARKALDYEPTVPLTTATKEFLHGNKAASAVTAMIDGRNDKAREVGADEVGEMTRDRKQRARHGWNMWVQDKAAKLTTTSLEEALKQNLDEVTAELEEVKAAKAAARKGKHLTFEEVGKTMKPAAQEKGDADDGKGKGKGGKGGEEPPLVLASEAYTDEMLAELERQVIMPTTIVAPGAPGGAINPKKAVKIIKEEGDGKRRNFLTWAGANNLRQRRVQLASEVVVDSKAHSKEWRYKDASGELYQRRPAASSVFLRPSRVRVAPSGAYALAVVQKQENLRGPGYGGIGASAATTGAGQKQPDSAPTQFADGAAFCPSFALPPRLQELETLQRRKAEGLSDGQGLYEGSMLQGSKSLQTLGSTYPAHESTSLASLSTSMRKKAGRGYKTTDKHGPRKQRFDRFGAMEDPWRFTRFEPGQSYEPG